MASVVGVAVKAIMCTITAALSGPTMSSRSRFTRTGMISGRPMLGSKSKINSLKLVIAYYNNILIMLFIVNGYEI